MTIWFWSDTHADHANILKFTSGGQLIRPGFAHVGEMADHMVAKFNSVVKPNDHVYHLGDVCMNKSNITRFMSRLNGKHRLVLGNHDPHDMRVLLAAGFEKIFGSRLVDRVLCTHFPVHPDHIGKAIGNVHGHIHQNPSPKGPYLNVSVEALNDYTPLSLEEVKVLLANKIDQEAADDRMLALREWTPSCLRCGYLLGHAPGCC